MLVTDKVGDQEGFVFMLEEDVYISISGLATNVYVRIHLWFCYNLQTERKKVPEEENVSGRQKVSSTSPWKMEESELHSLF